MDFDYSHRQKEWIKRVSDFMDQHVYPAEEIYAAQMDEATKKGDRWIVVPVLEELKTKAKAQGLWNLFLPHSEHGAGLDQSRICAAGRNDGPRGFWLGGVQLLGARHRQHGSARALRHARAAGTMAEAAARRRDPLGLSS